MMLKSVKMALFEKQWNEEGFFLFCFVLFCFVFEKEDSA
jgi:hypothetical protein